MFRKIKTLEGLETFLKECLDSEDKFDHQELMRMFRMAKLQNNRNEISEAFLGLVHSQTTTGNCAHLLDNDYAILNYSYDEHITKLFFKLAKMNYVDTGRGSKTLQPMLCSDKEFTSYEDALLYLVCIRKNCEDKYDSLKGVLDGKSIAADRSRFTNCAVITPMNMQNKSITKLDDSLIPDDFFQDVIDADKGTTHINFFEDNSNNIAGENIHIFDDYFTNTDVENRINSFLQKIADNFYNCRIVTKQGHVLEGKVKLFAKCSSVKNNYLKLSKNGCSLDTTKYIIDIDSIEVIDDKLSID